MIIDARTIENEKVFDCDICIVGAGAAGITIARELSSSKLNIILLESGGMHKERKTQDLYRGEVANTNLHGALHLYRQRSFGGTTNVWGGRCAPLDNIDFETRNYITYSGWPIERHILDEYYKRAHHYCEIGTYDYECASALPNASLYVDGLNSPDLLTNSLWRFSPPTNFRKAFLPEFKNNSNMRIFLHANCLKIISNDNGTQVQKVYVTSLHKNTFFVKAKKFVLAMGGLEVARILLLSHDIRSSGIGNENDLVGRFYGSHISGTCGKFVFRQGVRVQWDFDRTTDGVYCRRKFTLSERKQRELQVINMSGIIDHPPAAIPSHRNGVLSSMYLLKNILTSRIPPEYSKSLSTITKYHDVVSHLRNIVFDVPRLIAFTTKWIDQRIVRYRKLPAVTLSSKANEYAFHFDAEQSPNYESKVSLSRTGRDFFDLPVIKVDWRVNSSDIEMIRTNFQFIDMELKRFGVGRLVYDDVTISNLMSTTVSVGSHHLGTTRMASNAKEGVVDKNSSVFSTPNLFIAGPSVFASSGYANPVLTTVALSIKLSDHLRND